VVTLRDDPRGRRVPAASSWPLAAVACLAAVVDPHGELSNTAAVLADGWKL
jgi:hypothetical protein